VQFQDKQTVTEMSSKIFLTEGLFAMPKSGRKATSHASKSYKRKDFIISTGNPDQYYFHILSGFS
jgi:hypothetical protein